MAEPDRDRLWHRQSSRNPTRELQISGGFEDSSARFLRLLQQDFRPTFPMELHRSPCLKRSDQTARHLEGKLGKTNTTITDFHFGVPTTMTCGTSALSHQRAWVSGLEFDSSVVDFHLPVNASLRGVDFGGPGGCFFAESLFVRKAAAFNALAGQ